MPADVVEHGERVLGAERGGGGRCAGRRLSGHHRTRATGHGKQDQAWPLPWDDSHYFSGLAGVPRAADIYVGPRTNDVFPQARVAPAWGSGHRPAVHRVDAAVDVGGIGAEQEHDERGDLVGLAEALHRDAREEPLVRALAEAGLELS